MKRAHDLWVCSRMTELIFEDHHRLNSSYQGQLQKNNNSNFGTGYFGLKTSWPILRYCYFTCDLLYKYTSQMLRSSGMLRPTCDWSSTLRRIVITSQQSCTCIITAVRPSNLRNCVTQMRVKIQWWLG